MSKHKALGVSASPVAERHDPTVSKTADPGQEDVWKRTDKVVSLCAA